MGESPMRKKALSEQADAGCLKLNGVKDAYDLVRKVVDDSQNFLARKNGDIAENYLGNRLEIKVIVRIPRDNSEYHFIFRAIPGGREWASTNHHFFDFDDTKMRCKGLRGNDLVLMGITDIIHGPNGVIASTVWLASDHYIKYGFRDLFAGAVIPTFGVFKVIPEGEFCLIPCFSSSDSAGVTGLVQGSPQVVDDIKSNKVEEPREFSNKLDFYDLINSVIIVLNNNGVGIALDKSADKRFKLFAPKLGVLNTEP
jgi:hypothetical protein